MSAMHKILVLISSVILLNSCGGGGGSISVLPTTDAYDESSPVNAEMDILWVVDPSRSMRQNVKFVSDNIESFVADFVTKGYKFRMGVISTAAWAKRAHQADTSLPSQLSDFLGGLHEGECIGSKSGYPTMDEGSAAPNDVYAFTEIFRKNFDVYGLALNTSGCGLNHLTGYAPVSGNVFQLLSPNERSKIAEYVNDERPLQSMEVFLTDNGTSFLRPNAFLAVIIISDEMDASRTNLSPTSAYNPNDSTNLTADHFRTFLRGLKGGDDSKFAVYSILNGDLEGANNNIAKVLAESTGGFAFDIKADPEQYRQNLDQIKGNIISAASVYSFARKPMASSIEVEIIKKTGQVVAVPKAPSSGADGWTFDPNYGDFGGLFFNGSNYTPAEGDEVIVRFTPSDLSPGQTKAPYINISNNTVAEEQAAGAVVGTVELFNRNLGPNDEASFAITSAPGSFDIDAATGVITTNVVLDAETKVSEQVEVTMTITHKDNEGIVTGTTTITPRTFTIVTLDIPDTVPTANVVVMEYFESDFQGSNVILTGVLSRYVSGMDASETHVFTANTDDLTATDEEFTISDPATGAFTYTIPKSSLDFSSVTTHEREIPYTVAGSEHNVGGVSNDSSNTITIRISQANNAPEYTKTICPGGNYEYCDGDVVRPNTEGVTFGRVPLTGADVSVSGTASGNKDDLVATSGQANFQSAANPSGYHEVTITFPSNKMYEIGCIQVRRDDNSSLGNAIYQILKPGDLTPVTREVFPVGVSGNSNIPRPSNLPSGQCNTSSNYFTIYTESKFIGGGIRILRPSGAVNPQGHADLRLDRIEVFGIEAKFNEIDLSEHFTDLDEEDELFYTISDAFGEGPGPGWASVDNVSKTLRLLPSASVNETIGIIASDRATGTPGAKEAFATIRVVGSGGESVQNRAPISLLALDDSKRGGLSLRRWGGDNEPIPGGCVIPTSGPHNNRIDHIEMDNFMFKPFNSAQTGGYYNILTDPDQAPHNGDSYSSEPEGGWCNDPVWEDEKYPLQSIANNYCTSTNFNTSNNRGKIIPCVNGSRKYGEVYSGYFVPASTGIYKFRTNSIDNTVTLRIAPTEYYEDAQMLFTAVNNDGQLFQVLESLVPGFTNSSSADNEFENCGGCRSVPYNTEIFYDLSGVTTDYSDGYAYLKQGNVYAFEMRFGEGGHGVAFDFYYKRKDVGASSWGNESNNPWLAMDASVVVPDRGPNAYTPFVIPVSGGAIETGFNVSTLFYDAEMDVLEYTARLVNFDGTPFGDGSIGQIGLSLNLLSGELVGTLNSTYTGAANKPRIIIKAKERRSGGGETESLPIKFAE